MKIKTNKNPKSEKLRILTPLIWDLQNIGMSKDDILCEVISAILMNSETRTIITPKALKLLNVVGATIETP